MAPGRADRGPAFRPGERVAKRSGRPFKSGRRTNTVKATAENPRDPRGGQALTFEEDDSVVSARACVWADRTEVSDGAPE